MLAMSPYRHQTSNIEEIVLNGFRPSKKVCLILGLHIYIYIYDYICTPPTGGSINNKKMAGAYHILVYRQTAQICNKHTPPQGCRTPLWGAPCVFCYIFQQLAHTPGNGIHQPFSYFFWPQPRWWCIYVLSPIQWSQSLRKGMLMLQGAIANTRSSFQSMVRRCKTRTRLYCRPPEAACPPRLSRSPCLASELRERPAARMGRPCTKTKWIPYLYFVGRARPRLR